MQCRNIEKTVSRRDGGAEKDEQREGTCPAEVLTKADKPLPYTVRNSGRCQILDSGKFMKGEEQV